MDAARAHLLRQLPAVDELLRLPRLTSYITRIPRGLATQVIRRVLTAQRQALLATPQENLPAHLYGEGLLSELEQALEAAARPSIRRVINAAGVIIHTNLGRSPLAEIAHHSILEAAGHYTNLEYNLAQGARGSRQDHLEDVLRELTGAEGALVVNNNAAAVLLSLQTLAQGREVIISRGQLVEIGGSFRMPEIMAVSGAILKEVGTTNKTYLHDYEQAITSNTAALLKVHPSNFRILGFTQEVPLADLVVLGRRYSLSIMEDLGSGCLIDLSHYGLKKEPTVQETLATGADLVMFSGDKLLGGPQAGIILGNRETVQRLKQNPLMRALRPDKLTLAGLEATLRLYLDEPRAVAQLPTLRMLTRPATEVKRDARRLVRLIQRRLDQRYQVTLQPSTVRLGGGALPETPIPSWALSVSLPSLAPHQLEAALRRATIPVIARIEHQTLLLEVRTILPQDYQSLLATLEEVASSGPPY